MAITQIKIGDRTVDVDTSIADRLIAANNAKMKATGSPIQINEGFRTTERQAELYAQSQAGTIGRAAPPGQSFHETGNAIDVANPDEDGLYLNRYGLRNDLADDRGHFSYGETRSERFTSFAESVEKGRQRGFTDTELLNVFMGKQPSQKKAIEAARQRYGTDENIKNDRDLINFLALRYSGVGSLKTPSVAKKEPEPIPEEKGFFGRVGDVFKGAFSRRAEVVEEKADLQAAGEITIPELAFNFATQIFPLIGDIAIGTAGAVSPSATESVKEMAQAVAEADPKEKVGILQGLNALAQSVGLTLNEWEKFADKHPAIATDVESFVNIAEILPIERVFTGTIKGGVATTKLGVKGGKEAADAIAKAGKKIVTRGAEKGKTVTRFGISQATGLAPDTIEQVIKNPDAFTRAAIKAADREAFGRNVIGKIQARLDALKDTGKAYGVIRSSGARVAIDANFIENVIKTKHGLDVIDGKITSSTKSVTRNANDIKAIQNVLDNWGGKVDIDADEFLNLRSDLADLAKFDATKTKASQTVAKSLRAELNKKYRKQIPGLEKLDNSFAAETSTLKNIKNDFFKKDGTLRDNAVSKIANLTGKGKEQALERLKELVPDIEAQLRILRAIEDIRGSGGIKVGTYARSFAGAGGVLTGNVPLIIASILATPEIAVQLLRKYAKLKGVSKELLESTIKSIESGKKLVGKELTLFRNMVNDKSKDVEKMVKETKTEFADFLKENVKDRPGFARLPGGPKASAAATAKTADLATQASKYKTADEFIESQSLFHGTSAKIDGGVLKFGGGEQLKKGGYMGGHFLTDKPNIAKEFSFGGTVYRASGDIKNQVLDVNKNKKLFKDFIGKKFKNQDGEMEVFSQSHYDFMFPDGQNADWATVNADLANHFAKKQGKIGIAIDEYAGGEMGTTYQIFKDEIPIYTESQLTDIWNKAQGGDLATQAKQYKTADEFVKAQGKPLYHGTVEKGIDGLDPKKAIETDGAVFLTDNQDVADIFRLPREYGEVLYERPTGKFDDFGMEIYEDIEQGDLIEAFVDLKKPKILTGDEAQKFSDDTIFQGEIVRKAKADGYDGIIANNVQEGVGDVLEEGTTYAVFNADSIKTKSQLTDIWNKAQ